MHREASSLISGVALILAVCTILIWAAILGG